MGFISVCLLLSFFGVAFAHTAAEWKSRTIYQFLTDRFASTQVNTANKCSNLSVYCGGDYKGAIAKLDYIANMGFDAVWISPIITNWPNSYHGYHFLDLYTTNSHFGTEADLKNFIAEAHKRNIWVMLDVVANHVAPVDMDFSQIKPFNQSSHYHAKCQIENWNDQNQVEMCRLANLPDLDQNNAYVRSTLLSWIQSLQSKYGFDGYRIDTVAEIHQDFWTDFQKSAGMYCVGEVSNADVKYVAPYQNYMNGVLSYPLYYAMVNVFAYQQSMGQLEAMLGPSGSYWSNFKDVSLLGTFTDNHDQERFLYKKNNWNLYKNALVMNLFTMGIPIVYYGSEQAFSGGNDPNNRESLWPYYNTNHDLYQFLTSYVKLRKSLQVWTQMQVQRYSTSNFYAFSRGTTLVCLTNSGGGTVTYTLTYLPWSNGQRVCNGLNANDCLTVTNGAITVSLENGLPKVYIPK